jgi:hypothetical protein
MGREAAPVKGSPPPAWVVVTPPTELLGAEETVPPTELLVASRVVVVSLTVVVVVPPLVVAEASCPTLTPANTIRATATSQAAVRFCAFFVLISARPLNRAAYRTNKQPLARSPTGRVGWSGPRLGMCGPGVPAADRSA